MLRVLEKDQAFTLMTELFCLLCDKRHQKEIKSLFDGYRRKDPWGAVVGLYPLTDNVRAMVLQLPMSKGRLRLIDFGRLVLPSLDSVTLPTQSNDYFVFGWTERGTPNAELANLFRSGRALIKREARSLTVVTKAGAYPSAFALEYIHWLPQRVGAAGVSGMQSAGGLTFWQTYLQ